jgi:hypothetical protein
MKLRVLNLGINAEHDQITRVNTLFTELAFNDFDALVFDPAAVVQELRYEGKRETDRATVAEDTSGSLRSALTRHRREVQELVWNKGGVVICVLRENAFHWKARYWQGGDYTSEDFGPYFLLEKLLASGDKTKILRSIVHGVGEQIHIERGAVPSYLRILKASLRFEATIEALTKDERTFISATDSVGRIVAVEIKMGVGSLLFLPAIKAADPKRVGAALVQSVRELISKDTPDIMPAWVEPIRVPGADVHDKEITNLIERQVQLGTRLQELETAKEQLLAHRYLLFTTGKHILEPAVRRAFRVLGYTVSEPDLYEGEWDLEMRDRNGGLLIGEIEGPEGAVDLDKFRQALEYHTDRVLAGEDNKGLLVGNAHRLIPIGERPEPFTEHAIKGAAKMSIGLIPTSSLFNAVSEVLLDNSDELKARIQDSIAQCSNVWI